MYNKSLQDVPQNEHAGEGEGGGGSRGDTECEFIYGNLKYIHTHLKSGCAVLFFGFV